MSVPRWASLLPLLLLAAQSAVASELEIRQITSSPEAMPLRIINNCAETIWPALLTQAGKGVAAGFGLKSGGFEETDIAEDGQRRLWGRTNCSFNSNGSGAASGFPWARETGDYDSALSCVGTVCYMTLQWEYLLTIIQSNTPVTLFETTLLTGGAEDKQSLYNICLMDGYDLPTILTHIPNNSNPLSIPPRGRSEPAQARELAGDVTVLQRGAARNGGDGARRERMGSLGALVVMVAWVCLF